MKFTASHSKQTSKIITQEKNYQRILRNSINWLDVGEEKEKTITQVIFQI